MNTLRLVAVSALLITSQAYAVDSIVQGNLSAVPTGQANGREIHFKLPLNGDTNNCVVTISYGEKPGVGPNNDGDTWINGLGNVDRSRTYSADGTYTFTAKAKSGCTGQAKVTFTIGNPARVAMSTMGRPPSAGMPASPTMVINPRPTVTVTPTKMTGIVVSNTTLAVGSPLTLKLNGVGDPTFAGCGSGFLIKRPGHAQEELGYYHEISLDNGHWPKTRVIAFDKPGQYVVQLGVYAGAPASCGYQGPGSVPGDLTAIIVTDGIVK
jgi:hypothetical protein